MCKKYYITTPIFYPNGRPHIGHAYSVIAGDVLARYYRARGNQVFFLSGTDEHGLKMQQTAEKEGITPQELADRNAFVFKSMFHILNISNDGFIRTTEKRHQSACQTIWSKMEKKGDIYLDRYAGWYSVQQEAYYDEKDIELDDDGVRREKEVGSLVEWNEEESYFFRLSSYQEKLLDFYEKNPDFIAPQERRNEIISFVNSGLRDLSLSRTTFSWGIPVPNNPRHIMYVWVDALTSYLTGIGFAQEEKVKYFDFWPASVHMIGKDIIRFHAIYWPAFLMSAEFELPKRIFAHGFLLNCGKKMSKSVGNVIDPFQLIKYFGSDQVRYFFLREVPFGQDGSYTHEAIISRINADLANNLGNLAQRSLSMIAEDCDERVPFPSVFFEKEREIFQKIKSTTRFFYQYMEQQMFHQALESVFSIVTDTNRYFTNEEPWLLRRIDQSRFSTVIYVTIEVLRCVALMLLPFIPQSAEKLLDLLAIAPQKRMLTYVERERINPGSLLPRPQIIFPRYVLNGGELC